jgi:predicted phage terminase large subunit-like protein
MSTSVFWPAWEWGPKHHSDYRYILAAHKQPLAIRDNIRCRNLIQSRWYKKKWGKHTALTTNGKEEYHNINTGWRMAASVGGGVTGNRGDRVILDDPHSVHGADSEQIREETLRWFSEELPTRLNDMDLSAIIVIMQRVHERDVSGLILSEELGYEHLMLPMEYEPERCCYSIVRPKYITVPEKTIVLYDRDSASWKPSKTGSLSELLKKTNKEQKEWLEDEGAEIRWKADPRTEDDELLWPERFSKNSINVLKKTLRSVGGTYAEAGQLQQRPSPRGGGMFKSDDWEYCDAYEVPKGGKEVRGWDLAATSKKDNKNAAHTASCKLKIVNDTIYILDVGRKQASASEVETMIQNTAKADGHGCYQDLPQDPAQSGKAQKRTIGKLLPGYNFSFSTESGSKEDRASPLAAQTQIRNVFLVRGHWNSDFVKEGSLFPNGKFKDQIDAASRAYSRALAMPELVVPAGGGCVD